MGPEEVGTGGAAADVRRPWQGRREAGSDQGENYDGEVRAADAEPGLSTGRSYPQRVSGHRAF